MSLLNVLIRIIISVILRNLLHVNLNPAILNIQWPSIIDGTLI